MKGGTGVVENVTVAGNRSRFDGGGIAVTEGGIATGINAVVWGNLPDGCAASAQFSYSCVTGRTGAGMVTNNPLLAAGTYHLLAGSPCIDAGANLTWNHDAVDVDGQPRITNVVVDIGCDEWHAGYATGTGGVTGMSEGGSGGWSSTGAGGAAGPDETKLGVTLYDHSDSGSERYRIIFSNSTEVLQAECPDFGTPWSEVLTFQKGTSYTVRIEWLETNGESDCGEGNPDYDYTAWIEGVPNSTNGGHPDWVSGPGFLLHDPDGIMGYHDGPDCTSTSAITNCTATLYITEVDIEYVGGTSATDAKQEDLVDLDDEYFMKGYMLKITAPDIEPGSTVTWIITKAGSPVGTYHSGSAWTNYGSSLSSTPTAQTIFWRSDTAGTITDEYKISATFTPPGASNTVTCTRDIKSRELDPSVAQHRDNFNEDADMAQRAMIQVFGIDKGRLSNYAVGQYQDNTGGFYTSSRSPYPKWSRIADEVENFNRYALGDTTPSKTLGLFTVAGMWTQFELILAAGSLGAIDTTHADYGAWVNSGVTATGFTPPSGFPVTAADIVKGVVDHEDSSAAHARHSFTRFDPLAVSSVMTGENAAGTGATAHTFTDWGTGFGHVQPYNATGGNNLCLPADNLKETARTLRDYLASVPVAITGPKARVWWAAWKYNQGSIPEGTTPQTQRAAGSAGAIYADAVFNEMGITPPNTNAD